MELGLQIRDDELPGFGHSRASHIEQLKIMYWSVISIDIAGTVCIGCFLIPRLGNWIGSCEHGWSGLLKVTAFMQRCMR